MRHVRISPTDVGDGRRLLSVRAAAQAATCSDDTIRRAIATGELEAHRLGPSGNYRVSPAALHEWLTPAHDPKVTP
jgi:excisionase family DNA binding protein